MDALAIELEAFARRLPEPLRTRGGVAILLENRTLAMYSDRRVEGNAGPSDINNSWLLWRSTASASYLLGIATTQNKISSPTLTARAQTERRTVDQSQRSVDELSWQSIDNILFGPRFIKHLQKLSPSTDRSNGSTVVAD
ncbi:hypothetical protein GGS21DRAFT_491054 [Xylaria nigripes]|nr:hypothetical protein GGS21DRAFT_491054 [Xylaria nigripes]